MKTTCLRVMLASVCVAMGSASLAGAHTPSVWAYMNGSYMYDHAYSSWLYLSGQDTPRVVNLSTGQWMPLRNSSLADKSWSYWTLHPYVYCSKSRQWYWFANHTQWCRNMATGLWSKLGVRGGYLVIDLSSGPESTNYPVRYLAGMPAGGWTDEHKSTQLVLRRIPAGSFTMGSPENELGRRDADETQRRVTLTKDYYIGVFPVTQKQWERVMGSWPSYFRNAACRDTRPVEGLSYHDIRENPFNTPISPNWPQSAQVHANSFMGRIRLRTGLSTLDLPTETQWERACRAGTSTALNSGKNLTNVNQCPNVAEVARYWYNGGSAQTRDGDTSVGTAKVGSYLPNAWGLYDMHGNVWEWCLDWLEDTPAQTVDPVGAASGIYRSLRGGSWSSLPNLCRSAQRAGFFFPSSQYEYCGFRVAFTRP
jgi:formylglycine-generating enzyme required for sulfatase activity